MINISKTPNTISKVNFRREEYQVKDEYARNNIKDLKNEIQDLKNETQDLKEVISLIKSEIKQINSKLNNETFNFS